jgi:hypothetical protein
VALLVFLPLVLVKIVAMVAILWWLRSSWSANGEADQGDGGLRVRPRGTRRSPREPHGAPVRTAVRRPGRTRTLS